MRQQFKTLLLLSTCLVGWSSASFSAESLTVQTFNSKALPTGSGWVFGGQNGGSVSVSANSALNFAASEGSLKGVYPRSTGGVYGWATYDVSKHNLRDIYIEFRAKMPQAKQGLKFLKIFGAKSGASNYANTTFALDYTGIDPGAMYQVSFGDGRGTGNDTAQVINFDGSNPQWIGRSYGKAAVSTPQKKRWASSNWGSSWHHFRIRVKFNSGNSPSTEVADGAYYVAIDNVVYVDAKGLLNRHYTNGPIERIELFGWAQNGTSPFELWYDDVRVTTGGFYSDGGTEVPPPMAPGNFKIQ